MDVVNNKSSLLLIAVTFLVIGCGGGSGQDPNNESNAIVDSDGDGIIDMSDNCPNSSNSGQTDTNQNGIGDVCETQADSNPYAEISGVWEDRIRGNTIIISDTGIAREYRFFDVVAHWLSGTEETFNCFKEYSPIQLSLTPEVNRFTFDESFINLGVNSVTVNGDLLIANYDTGETESLPKSTENESSVTPICSLSQVERIDFLFGSGGGTGGGGEEESMEQSAPTSFEGTWVGTCQYDDGYGKSTLTLDNGVFTTISTDYSDSSCSQNAHILGTFSGSYELGAEFITSSGVTATKIDIDPTDDTGSVFQIIYRSNDTLYFGIVENDASRPTNVDFEKPFFRQ